MNVSTIKQNLLLQLEKRISSWEKMKKVYCKIKQKKVILRSNIEFTGIPLIDVELLQEASDSMIKLVQAKPFKD